METDFKIISIAIAVVAAFLFLISISIDGWGCGGSILSEACSTLRVNRVTGDLLMTAALLVVIGAVFLILFAVKNTSWSISIASVTTAAGALLSFTGVIYYLGKHQWWSPFLATFAMSFTIALAIILVAYLAYGDHG